MSVVRKKEALTTVIPLIKAQAKNTSLPKRSDRKRRLRETVEVTGY